MAMRKLSMCLDPSKGPPMDVTFLFKIGTNAVREVKAHKLILSIASDVFNREFYGAMKEPKDVIDIVDASHEVFQTMINFIYNKRPIWMNFDLKFLSSLYYLAEKYNIEDLKSDIIESIPRHKISKDYVLEIGILAEVNSHHEQLSAKLYELVATFLLKEFSGELDKALDFFYMNEENESHAVVIFKIMAAIKKVSCYRVIQVILVYLDPLNTPTQFRVNVSKFGKMKDLCSALAKLAKLSDQARLIVTDVYNSRFHKIYTGEDNLSNILDRDDIYIYQIDNSDPQKLVIPVYLREIINSSSYTSHSLFGVPFLFSLPKTCSSSYLYKILVEKMSRYVSRPVIEQGEGRSAARMMFSFCLVNSYGNAIINSFDESENIIFNCDSYLSLEWNPESKEKFYNDAKAEDYITK